jgi:hypothetical protein
VWILTIVYQFPLPLVTSPGTALSVQEYAYDPFPKTLWRFSSALRSMNVHVPWDEESSCGQASLLLKTAQSEREGVNAPRAFRQPMTSEGEASFRLVALRMRMRPVPVKTGLTSGGWDCAWARGDERRWRRIVRVERWLTSDIVIICGGGRGETSGFEEVEDEG